MSEDGKYNGWANYETWCVNLWLDNDGYFENLREEFGEDIEESENDEPGERADNIADRIESDVQELYADGITAKASMMSDLVTTILGRVDWHEIAVAFLTD